MHIPSLWRARIHSTIATLLAIVLVGIFLFKQHSIQTQLLGEQQEIALDTAYRAIVETTRRDIEARFRFQIMRPEVLELVAIAGDATEQELPVLRGKLYRLLEPVYREMEEIGLLQFQFHLPDDRVLLRFHHPQRSGDPLFSLRPSIRIVHTEQRPVYGLETGSTTSGFRYIFPLQRNNKHLGSVELSMPFSYLQTQMNRLLGRGEFALVFDRQRVLATVDSINRVYYSESTIHPGFLVENRILTAEHQLFSQSDVVFRLQQQLRENTKVQRLMPHHKAFVISAKEADQHYMISFLPVQGLSGESIAYVIRFKPSNAPAHLFNTLLSNLAVATALILLLGVLYFYNLRQRLQLQEDICRRQVTESELSLYANIFEGSGEAIMVTDHKNCITAINPAFSHLTGYTEKEVIGSNPSLLASGHTPAETYQAMWQALGEHDFWQGELWDRRKDGSLYPKWVTISAMRSQGEISHYIASFTNISDRKAAEDKIERLAHHDPLTGLLNRYSLELRLEQSILSAQREQLLAAVVFIDLDRFKTINDSLGHQVGDKLLIEVAKRLKQRTRDSDIVSRQGGDEFVVVLTGLRSTNDIPHVINAMSVALSQAYKIDQYSLSCTPSMGVAIFPTDGMDMETLLKNADTAMYHAKEKGRNNVQYFTAAMTQTAIERLAIEQDLRHAIQNDEFELYYQPQVCAHSQQILGVEALIRWHHPQQGLVPPLRFIPVAEESGLIETIGAWVLEEACRQLSDWRDEGICNIHIAVNLSSHQLRSASIVTQVAECMQRYAIKAGELELEITESVAMDNPEHCISQLMALRNLGVSLAIDDFGTGYSSLAYLKRLPIDILKLDRSFVHDIETDPNDAAISEATISMAHALGLKVVAEGVETQGQAYFLASIHDCDLLQGYLFGKPEPANIIVEQLKKHLHSH